MTTINTVLTGYEFDAVTGLPIAGATVEYWTAVAGTPAGPATGSTTTDANGMWQFAGLANARYDVKVTYSGRYRWYKGLSRWSISDMTIESLVLTDTVGLVANSIEADNVDDILFDSIASAGVLASGTIDTDPAYQYLKIYGKLRGANASTTVDIWLRVNGLSTNIYSSQMTSFINGATAYASGAAAAQAVIGIAPAASVADADDFGVLDVLVQLRNNVADNPSFTSRGNYCSSAIASGQGNFIGGGRVNDTTEITSLELLCSTGVWETNSKMTIIGVKR